MPTPTSRIDSTVCYLIHKTPIQIFLKEKPNTYLGDGMEGKKNIRHVVE